MSDIVVDKERALLIVQTALEARENGQGFFSEDIIAPEKPFINLIVEHGRTIKDDTFSLNALFLATSLDFSVNTYRYFENISDPVNFNKYEWLFRPEEVIRRDEKNVKSACKKFVKLAGYQQNGISQWMHNCVYMIAMYDGDIRNFFAQNDNDSLKIVKSLYVKPRAKNKPGFRRFGPKLATLFIQRVNQYSLYGLSNADKIGVPVDFQLGRISIQTGVVKTGNSIKTHDLTFKTLSPLYKEICAENNLDPREVSEALWYIGNKGCNNRDHSNCPLEDYCTSLISIKPYHRDGFFDPTDVGRYSN